MVWRDWKGRQYYSRGVDEDEDAMAMAMAGGAGSCLCRLEAAEPATGLVGDIRPRETRVLSCGAECCASIGVVVVGAAGKLGMVPLAIRVIAKLARIGHCPCRAAAAVGGCGRADF